MQGMRDDIDNIIIMGEDGKIFSLVSGETVGDDVMNEVPDRSSPIISKIVREEDGKNYFYAALKVYSIDTSNRTNEDIGAVFIKLKADEFLNFNEDEILESGWTLFFLGDNNTLIQNSSAVFDEDKRDELIELLGEEDENEKKNIELMGEKYYTRTYYLDILSGEIISIVPVRLLSQKIDAVEVRQYIIMSLSVIVLFVPFLLIIRNFLKPMKDIVFLMESIGGGNRKMLKHRLPSSESSLEIDILTESFNSMMDEINALTDNLAKSYSSLYEMKLETKKSELAHLRSQINPHFLYNTLESIKGIAVEENVPRITTITTALGNMFRYSIKGSDMVSLKEEINIVESYVMIQKIRFEDRFDVTYEFSRKITEWLIPKMLLQPLVENAIYHGLERITTKGHLYIGGTVSESGDMLLWVKDNGYGIDKKRLMEVKNSLKNTESDKGAEEDSYKGSIGLKNVNQRIRLMYGRGYGVNIESSIGEGTKVEILIPKDRGGN
jgi:two-component system sensor histidine kinase YesM